MTFPELPPQQYQPHFNPAAFEMPQYCPQAYGYSVQQPIPGFPAFAPPAPHRDLEKGDIVLQIVQQPQESGVSNVAKEKSRKPMDPAPILELVQAHPDVDPNMYFVNSPHTFVFVSLWDSEGEHQVDSPNPPLPVIAGNRVSSVYKPKDAEGREGAYCVFGDISIRTIGTFRLKFTLYDTRPSDCTTIYLNEIMSEPFSAVPKFGKQGESTKISRLFADQGVRLRLRKEPKKSDTKQEVATEPSAAPAQESTPPNPTPPMPTPPTLTSSRVTPPTFYEQPHQYNAGGADDAFQATGLYQAEPYSLEVGQPQLNQAEAFEPESYQPDLYQGEAYQEDTYPDTTFQPEQCTELYPPAPLDADFSADY